MISKTTIKAQVNMIPTKNSGNCRTNRLDICIGTSVIISLNALFKFKSVLN